MKTQVQFVDISHAGNRYEIRDDSWLPQHELKRIAPVEAEINLNRKGDSRVEVRGFLKTVITLVCDRCLADYVFQVDVVFHLILDASSDESWQMKELECSDTDLDTIMLDQPVVDLEEILRQQLYLSLPEKLICSEKCKGLCPHCGTDLNDTQCCCVSEEKVSPFAVLEKLKK